MRGLLKALGVALLVVVAAAVLVVVGAGRWLERTFHPDPTTVVRASLQAMQEQDRLTPFAARFVAVVTSEQRRWPFSTRKTLIMPGLVRYELDLARLRARDLAWDGATHTLAVTLPPIEVAGPDVDWAAVQEFGDGGVLTQFTDAEKVLDAANRRAGQAELLTQARAPFPVRLARDAARSAVARNFALPLKAAGVDATVSVRFADEPPAR